MHALRSVLNGGLVCVCMLVRSAVAQQEQAAVHPPATQPASAVGDRPQRILFRDDFEGGDLGQWDERNGTARLDRDDPHGGRQCLAVPMQRGKDHGGSLIKWFMPGADRVYARFYVRFSKDYQYPHHFVTLMGAPPQDRWRPFGKAGLKPDGSYFSSGMEPWFAWGRNAPPGELSFYSYFPDMEIDRKMNKYWGNGFFPPGPGRGAAAGRGKVMPALDRWQCWEFMIQANSTAEAADGEQAMWLDGKLVARFTEIRWRTSPTTRVNTFWLQHYGYDDSDPTREYSRQRQTVWFDDVVIATEYIGPARRSLPGTAAASGPGDPR